MSKPHSQKRIYGVKIQLKLLNAFLKDIGQIKQSRKCGDVDKAFEKRIMLAVTQVNGCKMCSFFHTKEALSLGMQPDEIKHILGGELRDVPEDETTALVFAQHYAEMIGRFEPSEWDIMTRTYGVQRARHILAYIRAIMVGNAVGNIMGALKSRFQRNPEQGSSFAKEIISIITVVLATPIFLVKNILIMPLVTSQKKTSY